MLNMLRRVEDVFVQIIRIVLLAFSVFILVGMGAWLWDHYKPKKPEAPVTAAALNWKDASYDLKFMEEETGRDLSNVNQQVPMEKRLADPALRPSFQKADGLLRGFIYKDPAARKRIEKENSAQGLDPVHPLLKGDAMPSADEVSRQIKMREARENSCCDKDAARAQYQGIGPGGLQGLLQGGFQWKHDPGTDPKLMRQGDQLFGRHGARVN